MKKFFPFGSTLAVAAVLMCSQTAFAQGGGTDTGAGGGTGTTTRDNRDNDNDTDYGWLGLLGLAGLAGLLKKPQREVVHHNDTPRTNPPVR
jgi:hypothetical protein